MDQPPINNTDDDPIQKEIDKLYVKNKKQEERIQNQETNTIQLVNLHFVFQGVILLTSTTTASSLKCHHWWIPFALSLLAAVLNSFTFFISIFKALKSKEELDQNMGDQKLMRLYKMTRSQLNNQVLLGTPFNQQAGGAQVVRPKPDSFRRWCRLVRAFISVCVFVVFSSVIMYGCYISLCNSDEGKCVKDF